jgi:hypothetical protein
MRSPNGTAAISRSIQAQDQTLRFPESALRPARRDKRIGDSKYRYDTYQKSGGDKADTPCSGLNCIVDDASTI